MQMCHGRRVCLANDNILPVTSCPVRHVAQEGVANPILCRVERLIFQRTPNPEPHSSQVEDSEWLITFSCVFQWLETRMVAIATSAGVV